MIANLRNITLLVETLRSVDRDAGLSPETAKYVQVNIVKDWLEVNDLT